VQLTLFDKNILTAHMNLGSEQLHLGAWCQRIFRANSASRAKASAQYFKPHDLPKDTAWNSVADVVESLMNGTLLTSGKDESGNAPYKFWLPLTPPRDSEWATHKEWKGNAEVLVSVEMVPADDANNALANGRDRDEPNEHPKLPPPSGRISFTINPFAMGWRLLGPKYCCRVLMGIGVVVLLLLFWSMLPVLLADGLLGILHMG
jgi:hypothetical protein